MASIADLISNLKKKLKDGYNGVADALPIVPNTSQIKSFASNPVQFMSNPSYNGGNNLYRTTPFKIGAQVQNFIESPKRTYDLIPEIKVDMGAKTPTANMVQGATNFALNLPINMAKYIGSNVIDTATDAGANIGRTITGRPLMGYEQVKSPVTRLGYQAAQGLLKLKAPTDTKLNAKEVIGNLGEEANVLLDASTGNFAKNLAQNAVKEGSKRVMLNAIKKGAIEGGTMGGLMGFTQGLGDNRKTKNNLEYARNVLTTLGQGALAGSAFGGATGGASAMWTKLNTRVKKVNPKLTEQEAKAATNDFIRNELGQFIGRGKKQVEDATEWIIAKDKNPLRNPYLTEAQKRELRRSLLLPEDGNYQGGYIKLDEPIVGTGKTNFSESLKNLAIRKNSPQELAYDLTRKLNNFDLGDIKLSKEQKIELQQWDNRNSNTINSRGITAVKESPQWIKDIWESTQSSSSTTPQGRIQNPLIEEAKKYKSAEEFVKDKINKDYPTFNIRDRGDINNRMTYEVEANNNLQKAINRERDKIVKALAKESKIQITDNLIPANTKSENAIESALASSGSYQDLLKQQKNLSESRRIDLNKVQDRFSQLTEIWNQANKGVENVVKPADAWNLREESYNKIDQLKDQASKTLWENSVTNGDKIKFDPKSQSKAKQLTGQIDVEIAKIKELNKIIEPSLANKGVEAPITGVKEYKVYRSETPYQGKHLGVKNEDGTFYFQEDGLNKATEGNIPNRADFKKQTVKLKNPLVIPESEMLQGDPSHTLFKKWFGDSPIPYDKTNNRFLRDKVVAEEAIKRGYDGIVYGNREIQDLSGIIDMSGRINKVAKPQFSPTSMTREEQVARDMLKKKEITPQQYNEIATKNPGKIKPIQQDPNKLYQQAKMIEDMAKNDRNMARAEAQAVQDTTLDLTVKDRQKLSQLGKIIRKADEKGMWDVETLRKENKGLVNWATERWRELNYGTKDNLTDDELINEIADFTERSLAQKVKVATPDTVKIRQGLLDERSNTVPNVENQYPVRNGKPVDAKFAERQAKIQEQAYEQIYGARNATNDELEALMNTPDSELKGGYKIEKKTDKPMIQLKGKKDEPKTFREIVNRFLGGKENIKLTQYEQVKPIANVKFSDDGAKEAIKAIESGNTLGLPREAQTYVARLRKSFDEVRREAVNDGLDIGYVENYLTHYWEQPMAQVQEVVNKLRKSGSFQKNRTFLTYQEGIDAGLTPRFSNPTQILGNYVRQVENVRNNLKFIKALEANGYVISGKERELTQGVRQIAVPGFEGRFARPEVANLIEGLFEPKQANAILSKLGKISGKIQDITLSGGIPKTPFNAFSIAGNLQKQFLAGRFTGPLQSFARAFSPDSTNKYFTENIGTIREIQGAGYNLPTTLSYKNLMGEGKEGVMSKAGGVWDSAMSDPTFKRFIPMMQIDLYKEVKNTALKSGLDEKQAVDKALQVLKNFEGMSDQFSQATSDPNAKAVTQTFLFAPKFRRAMIDFWVNSIKALKNPLAIENRYNTRFMAGAAITFAGMNLANAYFNNGKMMWENGKGKEDKLMIPDGKGGAIGVPFLSSIGTIPRGIYRQGISLVKGDITGAVKDAGQTYLSSGIKPLADVAANEDYFGKTIVQPDSNNKWLDVVKYLGKSYISHPYLKELVDPANTSDPAYQRLSRAMELPFRFYDKKSIDGSRYYEARDKAISTLSENEKKALDAIPKYDEKNPDTQIYKYQTFLTYPNVFEAKRATEFELAKQTGKPIDPLYLVNYETAKAYMRYETLPPGSQDRKDLIKAKPELGALFDVRSKYFDENPIEGTSVTVSKKPLPSLYVQTQMDAKNWADPEVRAYLDANTQYQNEQRAKLGLTPLAGFTPYQKKIKVAAMKKIKAPKIKLAKIKSPKIKIPKLKLARAKAVKLKLTKPKNTKIKLAMGGSKA